MAKVVRTHTFNNPIEARRWLDENGFSHGSTCRGYPVAVMWGKEWYIAKWRNLSAAEIAANHGSYDYYDPDKEARFVLYDKAPAEAIAAFDAAFGNA